MNPSSQPLVTTPEILRPCTNTIYSDLSIVSSNATKSINSILFLYKVYEKIYYVTLIFDPELDLSNSNILSQIEILTVTCSFTLIALSNTKAEVFLLENYTSCIYKNIDKVLKDIIFVSSRFNALFKIIALKSNILLYITIAPKEELTISSEYINQFTKKPKKDKAVIQVLKSSSLLLS
jgi:hypothetical protein